MKRLLVLSLFVSALGHADPASTLVRGVQYAGKLNTDHTLEVKVKGGTATLRKDPGTNGVIALKAKWSFTSHGYFLDKIGKLSPADHAALNEALGEDGSQRKATVYGLRKSLRERRAFEAHLAKVSPQIDEILAAAKRNPGSEREINSRVSYTVTAAGPTLMVDGTGVFIGRQGFELSDQQRADLSPYLK